MLQACKVLLSKFKIWDMDILLLMQQLGSLVTVSNYILRES